MILVGEIRDSETAEVAVQAALTGHLVLSTLHTNDAPGGYVRLANMGIEPFLITSTVVGIVSQRLARVSCGYCRELYELTRAEADAIGIPSDMPLPTVARSLGCKRCGGRGTRGRTAVVEILPTSDSIRRLILNRASGQELLAQAQAEGFQVMRESAIRKMLDLQISPQEVLRVFSTVE